MELPPAPSAPKDGSKILLLRNVLSNAVPFVYYMVSVSVSNGAISYLTLFLTPWGFCFSGFLFFPYELVRIILYFTAFCKSRLKILRNYVFLPCSLYVIIIKVCLIHFREIRCPDSLMQLYPLDQKE